MPSLYLLLKPSSHLCNLSCDYCFYKRVADVYPVGKMMTVETAEAIIRKTLEMGARHNSFTWQGGEPTLMGLDFYREVCRLQDKYRSPGQVVENSLQTNGVVIDDSWADFLKQRNFLVGLSLDGPRDIHDRYRKDNAGKGTYGRVMKAANLLRERGVPFNILVLLTDINAGKPEEIYRFLLDNDFTHLQFIPCLEYDEGGRPLPYSITGEQLGEFHTRLFDLWMEEGFFKVSIRIFEDIFIYLLDGRKTSCGWLERCGSYFLVEHNGDTYPCDFFVYPEWRLGNIVEDRVEELLASPLRFRFGEMKAELNVKCKTCPHLAFCRGDCTKFRWDGLSVTSGYDNISTFCAARKMLLNHIEPHIEEVRRRVALVRSGEIDPSGLTFQNVKRNDPCPCRSGRKYKKCCGR
ncbi:MAG: anaerobic sulfatase maturase [Deltaproteobacteria bacterium]|uniref:Anaerobic sulfatase maturase n=1 Tax=Candidatus Zymogenus saltonus TaxID=2844893 RepID=A0A9D8KH81_9DELT|nr:anaerobic sulfatase maturase [Candidatus Zymogenus saltonus]